MPPDPTAHTTCDGSGIAPSLTCSAISSPPSTQPSAPTGDEPPAGRTYGSRWRSISHGAAATVRAFVCGEVQRGSRIPQTLELSAHVVVHRLVDQGDRAPQALLSRVQRGGQPVVGGERAEREDRAFPPPLGVGQDELELADLVASPERSVAGLILHPEPVLQRANRRGAIAQRDMRKARRQPAQAAVRAATGGPSTRRTYSLANRPSGSRRSRTASKRSQSG